MSTYDVIVAGTGAAGSAAMWRLSKRGFRVLGLDRFPPAHDRGSSHGQTRAIRQAYFEHPDYVPLLRRAYSLWDELEVETEQSLFFRVGLLQVGPPDGKVTPGVLRSAARHDLSVQQLTVSEARRDFPGFVFHEQDSIVVEPDAGYLLVEQAVQAQLNAALALGAHWRQETVLSWRTDGRGVSVTTDQGTHRGDRLVLAGGPWSNDLLRSLHLPLVVMRKHQFWMRGADHAADRARPVFFFEQPAGFFYGFPELDERGLKAAEHGPGEVVASPQDDPRVRDEAAAQRVREFLQQRLPDATRKFTQHSVCYYTMTPDEHFVLDVHPQHSQVCFAAGLSGHGFKFAPLLGDVLADLSQRQATHREAAFLGVGRLRPSAEV